MIRRIQYIREQKKLPLRQHAMKMPEDIIQNMEIHGSLTGEMMTRTICFDHITTDATPHSNQYLEDKL